MKRLIIILFQNKYYLIALLMILPSVVKSQISRYSVNENLTFANYLVKKEFYDDAIFLLNSVNTKSDSLSDVRNYLLGWSLYNKKDLVSSSLYLDDVSNKSGFYHKSRFFSAYNNIYLKKFDKAKTILNDIDVRDSLKLELKNFQLAGIALLNKDLELYKKHSSSFKYKSYLLSKEERKLDEFENEMSRFNRKSPVVAGVLSAIVPGAGKFYVNKFGGGLSAFLATTIFGVITYENYRKAGIKNYKTIMFGSIFSFFYIGNIYGSIYAVKDYRNDFDQKMEYRITFHLHIPLRNTFN